MLGKRVLIEVLVLRRVQILNDLWVADAQTSSICDKKDSSRFRVSIDTAVKHMLRHVIVISLFVRLDHRLYYVDQISNEWQMTRSQRRYISALPPIEPDSMNVVNYAPVKKVAQGDEAQPLERLLCVF